MLAAVARRTEVRIAALWLVLGAVLAALTAQVANWYVMTDEMLYERLAISIGRLHSPLPQIHGELIGNVNQLYPLLLAPLFHDRLVAGGLHEAHVLNGFVMSSACIPAFLLAWRVTRSTRLAYVVAALSVCIPWIVLASFLMTEVVAFPVFLWAALALHCAVVSPRPRNDVLLLVALVVAILARVQFAVLLVVVPLVLLVHEVAFTTSVARLRRVPVALRRLVSAHRVLALTYGVLVVTALLLLAVGKLASVFGTYSVTAEGDLTPSGLPRALLEHLAPIALGLGIVPFFVGVTWLVRTLVAPSTREQHAFATMTTIAFAALLFEVASYDLRFGYGRLHDRYLFYVVPLILIAFAAMLREPRWSRWPLFLVAWLLGMAFAYMPVIRSKQLNVDSPVAFLNDGLLNLGGSVNGARVLLALAVIVLTLLLLLGAALLRGPRLAAVLLAFAVLVLPVQAGAAFGRLFAHVGTSGLPITLDQSTVFNWIDRKLGRDAHVTMIPYPFHYGTFWENAGYWWTVEFWNESVDRAAVYETAFTWTPETFPTIPLSFDRTTGRANVSPSDYAIQAVAETRFQLAASVVDEQRGAVLWKVQRPWRADWLAFDLYRDGWTTPNVVGTIRVFAEPGQTSPLLRYLTVTVRGPNDVPPRPFHFVSNRTDWQGKAGVTGVTNQISVCVPPHGFGDVRVHAPVYSPIYGDPRSGESFYSYARSGGVLLRQIALADETAPC